jgi:two-component system LytT family sensor kinase
MRQPLSRLRLIKAGLLFGAWTAYGLLCVWQAHYWYSVSKTPMSWADCFRYQLTYAYLWCALTPAILWFANRYRFERQLWRRHLLVHLVFMLLTVSIAKIAWDGITMPPTSLFHEFTWEKLFRSVESTFDTGPLLYAVVLLLEHAFIYYQRYQSGLVKASQLQTQLIQAQLQALRMQLHPHFLFNTLHTITALVHEDPEMAERTIARLSELLRLFLASSTIHEVPLNEELRILNLYLEIERARFEDRLRVVYEVPPSLQDATVPSLILQPLVENSIRHGIGRRAGPGYITVAAESEGDTLVVRVTDNGAGFDDDLKQPSPEGVGLSITRGRLESLYGGRQSLVLRSVPSGGVEARITMPLRTANATYRDKDHVELQSADR